MMANRLSIHQKTQTITMDSQDQAITWALLRHIIEYATMNIVEAYRTRAGFVSHLLLTSVLARRLYCELTFEASGLSSIGSKSATFMDSVPFAWVEQLEFARDCPLTASGERGHCLSSHASPATIMSLKAANSVSFMSVLSVTPSVR